MTPIVGGILAEKQERLLIAKPDIVVGTPGRLWELMSAGEKHLVEVIVNAMHYEFGYQWIYICKNYIIIFDE